MFQPFCTSLTSIAFPEIAQIIGGQMKEVQKHQRKVIRLQNCGNSKKRSSGEMIIKNEFQDEMDEKIQKTDFEINDSTLAEGDMRDDLGSFAKSGKMTYVVFSLFFVKYYICNFYHVIFWFHAGNQSLKHVQENNDSAYEQYKKLVNLRLSSMLCCLLC